MKRKSFFVLIICLLSIASAQAQFRLGIKGGINISEVYLNENVFNKSNITGFQVGPSAELMFGPLGLEASVLYSQRGLQIKDYNDNAVETRTNYINVPLNLKFKFGPPGLKFYALAGPYASFLISGDESINGIIERVNDQWEAQNFEAGLNVGAGIELLKFIQVGANYELGLTDDYSSNDYSAKNRTISITTTIFF